MAMRKAQMFVLTALIFSSLILLTAYSFQGLSQVDQKSNIKNYFEGAKDDHVQSFNHGLNQSYEPQYLKRKIYNTNRFILRRSKAKGIEYKSFNTIILPEKGHLSVINYHDRSLETDIKIGDQWYNRTLDGKQNTDITFSPGSKDVNIVVDKFNIDRNFTAGNPKLLNFIQMEDSDEKWISTKLH